LSIRNFFIKVVYFVELYFFLVGKVLALVELDYRNSFYEYPFYLLLSLSFVCPLYISVNESKYRYILFFVTPLIFLLKRNIIVFIYYLLFLSCCCFTD